MRLLFSPPPPWLDFCCCCFPVAVVSFRFASCSRPTAFFLLPVGSSSSSSSGGGGGEEKQPAAAAAAAAAIRHFLITSNSIHNNQQSTINNQSRSSSAAAAAISNCDAQLRYTLGNKQNWLGVVGATHLRALFNKQMQPTISFLFLPKIFRRHLDETMGEMRAIRAAGIERAVPQFVQCVVSSSNDECIGH